MNYQSQSVIEGKSKRKLSALTVTGSSVEQVHGYWRGRKQREEARIQRGLSIIQFLSYLIETEIPRGQLHKANCCTYQVQGLGSAWVTVKADKAFATLYLESTREPDMKN